MVIRRTRILMNHQFDEFSQHPIFWNIIFPDNTNLDHNAMQKQKEILSKDLLWSQRKEAEYICKVTWQSVHLGIYSLWMMKSWLSVLPLSSIHQGLRIELDFVWRTPEHLCWSMSQMFQWFWDLWTCSLEVSRVWCTSHQYVCTYREFCSIISILETFNFNDTESAYLRYPSSPRTPSMPAMTWSMNRPAIRSFIVGSFSEL